MHLSRESNPGQEHCRQTLYAKRHSNSVVNCYSERCFVLLQLPPKPQCRKLLTGDRGWVWLRREYIWRLEVRIRRSNLYCVREPCENCIMSGSPLCRGLTRATVEHPRQMCLSRESIPGPPALQANTLWKEPFEWRVNCYSEPRLVLLDFWESGHYPVVRICVTTFTGNIHYQQHFSRVVSKINLQKSKIKKSWSSNRQWTGKT